MLLEVLEAVWMYQGLVQKWQKTGLSIYQEIRCCRLGEKILMAHSQMSIMDRIMSGLALNLTSYVLDSSTLDAYHGLLVA